MSSNPHSLVIGPFAVAIALLSAAPGHTQGAATESSIRRCLTISGETQRLQCLKDLMPPQPQQPPTNPQRDLANPPSAPLDNSATTAGRPLPGDWRLVRTAHPQGGKDAISVMRTAEIAESDINLAGLMIRCGESTPETLVVLVRPLPPRAQPKVSIEGRQFSGIIVSPGAAILLPPAVMALVETQWRARPKLVIDVEDDGAHTKGAILLEGLDHALATLRAACLARQEK